jgi:hypothetical protein
MSRKTMPLDQILTILAETPLRLSELTAGIPPELLRISPDSGEWSATHVLAHLRACADVWGGCIATLVAEDHPTLRAVNPKSWIKRTDYLEQEFQPSLQAFMAQRRELLSFLETLAPEDWARTATMTGAGRPIERTVHSFAGRMARHERPHIKQVERAMTPAQRRISIA